MARRDNVISDACVMSLYMLLYVSPPKFKIPTYLLGIETGRMASFQRSSIGLVPLSPF